MDVFEAIYTRRSIRKYQKRQISREDVEKILEAGTFAPNAGGGQRTVICGIRNKSLVAQLGAMNLARFDRSRLAGGFVSKEQPYLSNVYPGETRSIGIIFCIRNMTIEYFNLGVNPIFRETYTIGNGKIVPKGYFITDECISCGKCAQVCPQNAIATGSPSIIRQEHCLHCGNCFEHCPVSAIRRN